jgi:hypothetical protein
MKNASGTCKSTKQEKKRKAKRKREGKIPFGERQTPSLAATNETITPLQQKDHTPAPSDREVSNFHPHQYHR